MKYMCMHIVINVLSLLYFISCYIPYVQHTYIERYNPPKLYPSRNCQNLCRGFLEWVHPYIIHFQQDFPLWTIQLLGIPGRREKNKGDNLLGGYVPDTDVEGHYRRPKNARLGNAMEECNDTIHVQSKYMADSENVPCMLCNTIIFQILLVVWRFPKIGVPLDHAGHVKVS